MELISFLQQGCLVGYLFGSFGSHAVYCHQGGGIRSEDILKIVKVMNEDLKKPGLNTSESAQGQNLVDYAILITLVHSIIYIITMTCQLASVSIPVTEFSQEIIVAHQTTDTDELSL